MYPGVASVGARLGVYVICSGANILAYSAYSKNINALTLTKTKKLIHIDDDIHPKWHQAAGIFK